jgi:cell wall-associated protease
MFQNYQFIINKGDKMKWIAGGLLLGVLSTSYAARIAVIDSGLDTQHEAMTRNLWTNSLEVEDRRDNDGNGYQDDVHGWNFAEQNGRLLDKKFLGIFSPDCKKFFDIQGKIFLDQASEEEIEWLKSKTSDAKFISELSKFGNFVHGTHVAGITISDSQNEVMGIKLIPTEIKPFFQGLLSQKNLPDRWDLIQLGFEKLAEQQMSLLAEIGSFIHLHKMDVANGSFGTGFNQAKMFGDIAFRVLFFRKPRPDESLRAARIFMDALLTKGEKFVASAPNTLFVFAAGNDGLSNDDYGTSPANIKADNSITVGATYKNEFFAPFSNYGVNMVDIAAPGMLVHSPIPGNDYLEVSGTSQAAPYVARVAGMIKDANPKLTPSDIKKILMGTVDKKAYLKTKVAAGGVVNPQRAIYAADLSKKFPLIVAITTSKVRISDAFVHESKELKVDAIYPMPIFSLFK